MAQRYGPHRYEFELGKRKYSLEAQLDEIVTKTQKRMDALMRQSTQELINEAQKPVGKGGKMRVDTGFLRASGRLSLNGAPSGPSRPEKEGQKFASADDYATGNADVVLNLTKAQAGDVIFFGWTANYAKYREAYDGFLEAAVQKWPEIVAGVTEKIKARIKK